MIGSIRGKILLRRDRWVLVESGGVGYRVYVNPPPGGEEIFLYTHTHVREDALDLYGFLHYEELEFFEMLLDVSGVGPKGALAILGITSIESLRQAISTGDTTYLTKVSGIGKKTAEKIAFELRDKVARGTNGETHESLKGELDALEALRSLGYREHEAREALKKTSSQADTRTKIREALKILGGN